MGLAMIKPSSLICVLAVTLVGNGQTNSQKEGQKDIAAIAKETNGAVVSIVMSDKKGQPVAHGSSCRPLFKMVGEVVGITPSHLRGGESLNFAIPISAVKSMLLAGFSKARPLAAEAEPAKAVKSRRLPAINCPDSHSAAACRS